MKIRFIATLAMAAAAGAIGLAPIAASAPTGTTTTDTGGATIVERPGNAQITATPGQTALQVGQFPYYGGYGYGYGYGYGGYHHHHGGHR